MTTVEHYNNYDYLALFDQETEDSIYHYTSLNTLLTILNGKKLRFSNRLFLNDSSEGKYVLQLCLDRIEDIWDDTSSYDRKKFEEYIEALQKHITIPQFSFFQASFSLDEDSLPMWNYYAKAGGVNLEFARKKLLSSLKGLLYNNTLGKLAFLHGKVVYNQDKQVEILNELISDFKEDEQYSDEWYLFVSWAVLNVGTLFKHPKFECEKEYRIAYNILIDPFVSSNCISLYRDAAKNEPYSISVYEKNGMLIPYIDIDFDKNAVKGIRTSPLLSSEYIKDGLKIVLDKNGFDKSKVAVEESEIPLRF